MCKIMTEEVKARRIYCQFFILYLYRDAKFQHSTNRCQYFSGILQREDGLGPEDEENFEEALKAANTALEPTRYQRCKTLFCRLY
jgi:hypothetical protein